jgi:hypothetical protein
MGALHQKVCEGSHVEARDPLHQLLLQVLLQQVHLETKSSLVSGGKQPLTGTTYIVVNKQSAKR